MKSEDILNLWEADCVIDRTDLGNQSLYTPSLHAKYWRILSNEKKVLRVHEASYKQLYLQKFEFLTQGPTKETVAKNWQLPAKGCLLKSEADQYISADEEIISLMMKIGSQREKIAMLEDIIKSINTRNWIIRNAIEYFKWQTGEN